MKRLRRLTLAEQVTFAFAVGVVYLAAVGAVAYTSVVRLGDATERATRTYIVLRLLDETFAFLAGAETGSRGFVITGDTRYLESYQTAEIGAAKRLKSLETSIDDRVQQHERLRRLVPLVARRFSLLEESVRLRTNKEFDDAVFATRTGRGRMVMDSIRALVDSMSAEETTQLRERSVQERRSLRRAAALIGVSFFAAVTLGLAAALFVSRDIGRRLRAEEEARHAKEVAEAASRAKSEFLAMMSHELRTPLNSVIGFSNVLLRNRTGNLRERDLLYLQRIRAGGQHLLSLINEVLDLSKIEAGRMGVEQTSVSLGALVEDTIASFEGQVRGRPIVILAETPQDMTPIVTDPAKLLQVLTNLIGNAIKFTERGSVTVRVVADVASGRPERIDVADTGIGIPADRQQAIFDAFEQADSSTARQFGGTGLGLAVSKSLCDLLGYTLEVRSEVGVGSEFSVILTASGRPHRTDRPRLTEQVPTTA